MVYSVGFHRANLLHLGKADGKRVYQTTPLPLDLFRSVQKAVLHGLGMSDLTKHLQLSMCCMWRLWKHPH